MHDPKFIMLHPMIHTNMQTCMHAYNIYILAGTVGEHLDLLQTAEEKQIA